jgi:hypothetical protein
MKQVRAVVASDVVKFAIAMNEVLAELSRFEIERIEHVSALEALIYYDIPDEVIQKQLPADGPAVDYDIELDEEMSDSILIRINVGRSDGRWCCECDNYRWGRGCPYRDGMVRQMDKACSMFNVVIERR